MRDAECRGERLAIVNSRIRRDPRPAVHRCVGAEGCKDAAHGPLRVANHFGMPEARRRTYHSATDRREPAL